MTILINMENKKLGGVLIAISLALMITVLIYNSNLSEQSRDAGCYTSESCLILKKNVSVSHFAIGIISFILALGFYLLFFNKTEKAILDRLEKESNQHLENLKFNLLMKALDPYEKKVIETVREHKGITQSSLRIKLDMSKAKLSYVLQELEKRNLIKRKAKGKTLQIYLKI